MKANTDQCWSEKCPCWSALIRKVPLLISADQNMWGRVKTSLPLLCILCCTLMFSLILSHPIAISWLFCYFESLCFLHNTISLSNRFPVSGKLKLEDMQRHEEIGAYQPVTFSGGKYGSVIIYIRLWEWLPWCLLVRNTTVIITDKGDYSSKNDQYWQRFHGLIWGHTLNNC